MSHQQYEAKNVPIVTTITGEPLRALSADTAWQLEEREGSTNRLTLDLPVDQAHDIVPDAEVFFRGRRFRIAEVNKQRADAIAEIEADEAQAALSDHLQASYKLNGTRLSAALTKALAGTSWTSAGVFDDTGTYFTEFENEPVTTLLRFLQTQSGQWLEFDSMNRTVSLIQAAEAPLDRVLTYGVGVTDIEKNATAPAATVIEPTGRGGMTIEQVNGGKSSVEDFSWYTSLGVPIAQARVRFTKKQFWHDDRYVYAMNLKRDAQGKLAELSQPQINYKVSAVAGMADGLRLGDRVWVVDEELGVRLATRVVRAVTSSDASQDEIELDYLPRSFTGDEGGGLDGDSTPSGTDLVQFQVKNEEAVTLGGTPSRVLASTIQVTASTSFQVGLVVRVELDAAARIEGYFLLNGARIDPEIMQDAGRGWSSFGMSFLVTQIPEGSQNFDFYMLVSAGSAVVPYHGAEMFIATRAALGGLTNTRPDRAVTEYIGQWFRPVDPIDEAVVIFPIQKDRAVAEHIGTWLGPIPTPAEAVGIAFGPTIVVTGGILTASGMFPGQVFTLRIESDEGARVGEDAYTADENGDYTLDLVDEFAMPAGNYTGYELEFGQTFDFTVEASTW